MKEIMKASPNFGKGVGYKMCVVNEFEKEAEERARKLEEEQVLCIHSRIYNDEEDYEKDRSLSDGEVAGYKKGFKDGAEFGYNKANEESKTRINQHSYDKLRDMLIWHTEEPPKNTRIELLCVLFDEDEYRTLKKNEWSGGYNRFIVTGTWNGAYFRGEINHASGDPFPKVVAWRPMEEQNLGAPFYPRCLGECRD